MFGTFVVDAGDRCKFCNGNCCDPKKCEDCNSVTRACESKCKPNETCCDGSCCSKVWTTETHPAITESCPPVCDQAGCDGITVTVQGSYESCLNVGVGQGGHCECNKKEQVVGYEYTCQEDWDWDRMTSCLLRGAWCVAECYLLQDPVGCANCLAGNSDCCDGPCQMCDFLESCDPTNAQEIRKNVFIDFGDCQ